jgi:GT2 family glycosyltransferase
MRDLSLIVCTRNRVHALGPTFDSIVCASARIRANVEFILVDNGSTDGTVAFAERWAADAPLPVTIVAEPARGLATARNAGIRAAAGDVLAFTDDDCRLDADYIAHVLESYADDPEPAIRGGRIELGDPRDLPFTIKTDQTPARYTAQRHPGGFIHGANMTMRRSVVDRIGLFDTRFGAGATFLSAEDTEYIYRAYLAGICVEYTPSIVVFHHHGRRARDEVALLNRRYAQGNGALYAKYIRQWGLLRNLFWDVKGAFLELLGGPPIDPVFGFSYRSNVIGCMTGMARYAAYSLRRSV